MLAAEQFLIQNFERIKYYLWYILYFLRLSNWMKYWQVFLFHFYPFTFKMKFFDQLHNFIKYLPTRIGPYLKGLAMIFAGQENPLINFRSKDIYMYFQIK